MKYISLIFLICISLSVASCFLKQDRTTTVYGTIIDEKGDPVDSITLSINGMQWWQTTKLTTVVTDSAGEYSIMLDVSKKFSVLNIGIPMNSSANSKFQRLFSDYDVFKNDQAVSDCCTVEVGAKTKYDFRLIKK